jgi:hypothetical protein
MSRQRVRLIAIPVAVVLCIAAVMWPQVQSLATILLLLVTFEYVLLTQENIELFRRQLLRQETSSRRRCGSATCRIAKGNIHGGI